MARYKDFNWSVPLGEPNPREKGSTIHTWDAIKVSLLLDIRDELQSLNATLQCGSFQGIPRTLRSIEKNTKKRPRKTITEKKEKSHGA